MSFPGLLEMQRGAVPQILGLLLMATALLPPPTSLAKTSIAGCVSSVTVAYGGASLICVSTTPKAATTTPGAAAETDSVTSGKSTATATQREAEIGLRQLLLTPSLLRLNRWRQPKFQRVAALPFLPLLSRSGGSYAAVRVVVVISRKLRNRRSDHGCWSRY
ncbi:hypothetical protein DL765_010361 [Monosporascus sp. GIB2]|nr:hypothetical protein DL765_010361 [Monosporascus sp. GIB2]